MMCWMTNLDRGSNCRYIEPPEITRWESLMKNILFSFLLILIADLALAGGGGSGPSQHTDFARCKSADEVFVLSADLYEDNGEWTETVLEVRGKNYSGKLYSQHPIINWQSKRATSSEKTIWGISGIKEKVSVKMNVDAKFGDSYLAIKLIDSGKTLVDSKFDCSPL